MSGCLGKSPKAGIFLFDQPICDLAHEGVRHRHLRRQNRNGGVGLGLLRERKTIIDSGRLGPFIATQADQQALDILQHDFPLFGRRCLQI
ncbi:hypothetical protein AA309_14755 [Microvirga vignae]|uniref:Uncharacterized protein n=1 Tax=Microvirga vignae TaxID=1225564 RepID=A0A0H1RAM5_9HYPH|nr:hypothetical protein AA309_14755 [Microvirga vignae]